MNALENLGLYIHDQDERRDFEKAFKDFVVGISRNGGNSAYSFRSFGEETRALRTE